MNTQKEILKERLAFISIRQRELSKEIEYLYLQENFCLEKMNFYKAENNAWKELYWLELSDYCENLYIKKKKERDNFYIEEMDKRNELIRLLKIDINKTFAECGSKFQMDL